MEEQNTQHNNQQSSQQNPGQSSAQSAQTSAPKKDQNTLMAGLAYLGPLVFVSYIVGKDDPFVKFHIKQGLVLLVGEVGMWFLGMLLWALMPLIGLINLGFFVLIIIGLINVVQGKEKELPLVGSLSKHFSF